MWISIHALAKRATDQSVYCTPQNYNFNPRPRKEGDAITSLAGNVMNDFNPRPRKEGDRVIFKLVLVGFLFQSTPSQRGRHAGQFFRGMPGRFQSTPSQRGRRYGGCDRSRQSDFNPRPRKEGDFFDVSFNASYIISIHALAKRATANLYNDYLYFEAKYHISDIFPL